MSIIEGIQAENYIKGVSLYVKCNYKKHSDAMLLTQKKEADKQEKEWENALSPDEFMSEVSSMLKRKFDGR